MDPKQMLAILGLSASLAGTALGRVYGEMWMVDARAADDMQRYVMAVSADSREREEQKKDKPKFGSPCSIKGGEPGRGAASKDYRVFGSVALLDIWGVLDKTDAEAMWDGTSYESIRRGLAGAVADDRVSTILMRFNSPGGAAMSVEQPANEIAAIVAEAERGAGNGKPGKRVVAFADDLMASAAFYLGTQASKLFATPGAWIGSIGTIMMHLNISGLLDKYGVKVEAIKSTPTKDVGSMFRPMSEADRAVLQAEVMQYDTQFVNAVMRGRKVTRDTVEGWRKDKRGYVGKAAVDAGLADGIYNSVEDVIAALNGSAAGVGNQASNGRRVAAGSETPATDVAAEKQAGPSAHGDDAMNARMLVLAAGGPDGAGGGGNGSGGNGDTAKVGAEVLAGERKRVAAIKGKAALFPNNKALGELASKAVDDGTSAETFGEAAMSLLADQAKPTGHVPGGGTQTKAGGADVRVSEDARDARNRGFEMSLLNKMAGGEISRINAGDPKAETLARSLGFESAQEFRKAQSEFTRSGMRAASLTLIASQCIAASPVAAAMIDCKEGDLGSVMHAVGDNRFMSAANHSSSDFPKILSTVANKRLLAAFNEQDVVWDKICARGTASDYKARDIVSLSEAQDFEDLAEGDTPNEKSFNERKEQIQVGAKGYRFSMTYQMMRNDDLSAFSRLTQLVGQSARRAPDKAFITLLTSNSGVGPTMGNDSVAFFASGHRNYDTTGALGQSTLESGWTKMRQQYGFGKDTTPPPLDIIPRILLVPVNLELLADKLVNNEYEIGSTGAQLTQNIMRGKLTPVASARLTNTTRWYLFADPASWPAFMMDFLDGVETPEITPINDGDPMSIRYQATIRGFGVAAVQFEAAYCNAGG